MRNLKKVMALALATVMLLGMMVMGAGAADYKDADQIDAKYGTAVDLLKAIGVFEGDDKGNLNPKNTLNRAEAAKVIAYLALTKGTASKLGAPAEAPFADIAGYPWAAGSIAYAKQLGIVSGVGGDNYDPAGTLTGYAFAKMLLVVLGYNADSEGYKTPEWATNVNLDALQAGLLNGLSINLADAITREQAIQMAYNALLADCVEYPTGAGSIVIGDVTINMGGNAATKVYNSADKHYAKEVAADEVMQLIEKLYAGYVLVPDTNEIGLAEKVWEKDGKEVASQADYKVLASYSGAIADVKAGTIYTDAGYVKAEGIAIYKNDLDTVIEKSTDVKKDGAAKPGTGYNGGTMKFIKNGAEYLILIEVPTLATVTKVNAATAKAGATVELDIKGDDDKALTIETENYVKDQKVVVSLGKKDGKTAVLTHKAADVKTGTVTETAETTDAVTGEEVLEAVYVDGVKYPIAGFAVNLESKFEVGKKSNVVVENGYIVDVSAIAGSVTKADLSKVYYVAASTSSTDTWGDETFYAQLVSMADATVVMQEVNESAKKFEGKFVTLKGTKAAKELVDFDGKDSDGKVVFEFTTLAEDDNKLAAADKAVNTAAGKAYITGKSTILSITGSKNDLAAKYVAAPFDVDIAASKAENIKVIYSTTKEKAKEVEVMVFVTEKALKANAVETKASYYVIGDDLGSIYNAAEKKTFTKIEVLDLKTFEKITVQVASNDVIGFAEGTANANGVYTFVAKDVSTVKKVERDQARSLYGTYLTAGGVVDYETANAKVINLVGAKTADGKATITTVAELVKTGHPFSMDVTAKTSTVNYIIITK